MVCLRGAGSGSVALPQTRHLMRVRSEATERRKCSLFLLMVKILGASLRPPVCVVLLCAVFYCRVSQATAGTDTRPSSKPVFAAAAFCPAFV